MGKGGGEEKRELKKKKKVLERERARDKTTFLVSRALFPFFICWKMC